MHRVNWLAHSSADGSGAQGGEQPIELPAEGRSVPPAERGQRAIGSLSFTGDFAERSSPSRVRYAAQNQRALDCSGPFHRGYLI